MRGTILVINRIGTLRRHTCEILRESGDLYLAEASDTSQARQKLPDIKGRLLTIMEFTAEPSPPELEFLKDVVGRSSVAVTAAGFTRDTILKLGKVGVRNLVVKNGNMEEFEPRLQGMVDKWMEGS